MTIADYIMTSINVFCIGYLIIGTIYLMFKDLR
jgi:hypothetical protein